MVATSQPLLTESSSIEDVKFQELPFSPERLRTERENRGWSRADLARLSDVPEPTVKACELKNANPTVKILRMLGKPMNIVWQADWREEKKPKQT